MELNDLIEKATAHVVKMLDGTDGERWNGENPMYEGVCGWGGVMSPMNRPAFVSKYGETFTAMVEGKAKETLASRAAFWENSKAKGYETMADNAMVNDPAALEVGMFIWGVTSGLKCDHGSFKHSIENMLWMEEEHHKDIEKRLCRIDRIEEVEDLDTLEDNWLGKWKPQGQEGGSGSDDVTEEEVGTMCEKYRELTAEQKRTFYTIGVLVRDRKGKYVFIDPEGYDYVRYLYLPLNWKAMYEDKYKAVVAEREAEEKAKAEAKEKAAAERKAAYDARCKKWEGIMQPVPAVDYWHKDYRKVGKRNIAAMAKAAFPWVRFSVSYDSGWGRGYTLKWKNGPTKDEVKAACDFGLFCTGRDTFDGMTDSSGYERAEFADFAHKFGGVDNGVELEREECDHDQNGDPNGKPSKPTKTETDHGNDAEIANAKREMAMADADEKPDNGDPAKGDAYWKRNEAKRGIEIYFPAMPSEAIRTQMKMNGWRWSRFAKAWYNRFDEGTWEMARCIVMEYNNERAVA